MCHIILYYTPAPHPLLSNARLAMKSCRLVNHIIHTGYCRKLDATFLSESLPRASFLSLAPSLSTFDDAKQISVRVGLRMLRGRKQTGPIHRHVRVAQPASMLHDSLHNPIIKTSNPCAKKTMDLGEKQIKQKSFFLIFGVWKQNLRQG